MPTSFYDVVVIGDELAGAVAAAHLARRGFRTLVACSTPSERDQLGEYTVPRAPVVLTGLESPALKRLSNEMHLLQLLRRRVEPLSPAFQVLLPDHRIDVSHEDLARELYRELPAEGPAFDAWAARATEVSSLLESLVVEDVTLPPDGFWDRRDLKRIAAQLPSEPDGLGEAAGPGAGQGSGQGSGSEPPLPPLARLIATLPTRFASDLAEPGMIARARLGDLHRRGTWRLDGGRDALRSLVLDRIKTYSGEVRLDVPVHSIEVKRGRVVGVRLGIREEVVGCGHVICAMPAAEAARLVGDAVSRKLAAAAETPTPLHRYLLHAVAPLEALPDALGRLAFSVRDPNAPLEGANALAIHLTPGAGRHATLTAEALTRDPSPANLARLRAEVRAHLDTVVPFLDRHLRAVWSPHDGLPPERLDLPASAVPARRAMDTLLALPTPRPIGVCGLPHATGIKQLLLASRQVMPGLGFEGELVAGWGAARLIASRDKKRVIQKRELLGT